jgi:hypothetical protein
LLAALVNRVGRLGLLGNLAVLRLQSQLAAGVQVEVSAAAALRVGPVLQVDVALGVHVHVPDARPLVLGNVGPGDALLEAGLNGAVLDQYLALEEQDPAAARGPGGDLVGMQDDGLGVAGQVAREA